MEMPKCIMATTLQGSCGCHSCRQHPWPMVHIHISSSRMATLIRTSCRRLLESIAISPPTSHQQNDISCCSSLKKNISYRECTSSRRKRYLVLVYISSKESIYSNFQRTQTELSRHITRKETH